ncbi:MAG: GNAT family N-acetyltransferase [Hyphomicrobiales bacterium]|nr:GNAT family N-acetyltransferase [Hyphomicrobiales bacterium]
MKIIECKTDEQIRGAYALIGSFYTSLSLDQYLEYAREMMAVNYRMIAVLDDGNYVGICGFRVGRRFYCGRYIHIDNMYVEETHRSGGIGKLIIQWVREEGQRLECDTMLADTYIDNTHAQRFFEREGFYKRGYHLKYDYPKK